MGIRDYFGSGAIALIEWSEKGGILASPDLVIGINITPSGRQFNLEAKSAHGAKLLQQCKRV